MKKVKACLISELTGILEVLNVTQDKIKRNPSLYTEEFNKHLNIFKVLFSDFIENPNKKIKGMKELILFFCHISHIYTKELAFIPFKLTSLIENNYSIINPEIRIAIVEGLSLLRKKDLLDPTEYIMK